MLSSMNGKKSIEVTVAGHKLPIKTSAPLPEVQAAAQLVEEKLVEIASNKAVLNNQVLLLVALNLADEYLKLQRSTRNFQDNVKNRSDALLSELDEHFGLEP